MSSSAITCRNVAYELHGPGEDPKMLEVLVTLCCQYLSAAVVSPTAPQCWYIYKINPRHAGNGCLNNRFTSYKHRGREVNGRSNAGPSTSRDATLPRKACQPQLCAIYQLAIETISFHQTQKKMNTRPPKHTA